MHLYGDWPFLRSVGVALSECAVGALALPANNLTHLADLQNEAEQFGLPLPDPVLPEIRRIRNLNSRLAQRRATIANQIMHNAHPLPTFWVELAERLAVDADPFDQTRQRGGHPLAHRWPDEKFCIRDCFAKNSFYRAATQEKREEIRADVTSKLYYVVTRNAQKWYDLGDHQTEWWGFVFRQLPSLIRRASGHFP